MAGNTGSGVYKNWPVQPVLVELKHILQLRRQSLAQVIAVFTAECQLDWGVPSCSMAGMACHACEILRGGLIRQQRALNDDCTSGPCTGAAQELW